MKQVMSRLLILLSFIITLTMALEQPKLISTAKSNKRPERYELIITAKDIKDSAEYMVFKYPHKLRRQKNDLKYRLLQHLLASQTSLLVQQVDDDGKVYSYLPTQEIYDDETGQITELQAIRQSQSQNGANSGSDDSNLPEIESTKVVRSNEKFVPKRTKQTVQFPRHKFVAQKVEKSRHKEQVLKNQDEYSDYDSSVRSPYRRNGQY
ncbi:uncharacterized protein KQ657_002805 [Scheffersomyces spartinae]|uniref:Uncharacterized protein n=1 Tax=Scheffersomyces spartinae TaxID=45513 RepID=A0A9P7V5V0_9ASCO|nr:uncharacterized protein KQ657_002805 [Scheffersomyces spartinae]KAG7191837.1 hypothetical protein KQ657_002805 [Scheffersomyces spartinae]